MTHHRQGLALVTGASTGIGLELARLAARDGHDLILCADEPAILQVAEELGVFGRQVTPVQADLTTAEGLTTLVDAVTASARPLRYLMANAGRGLGHAFVDQDEKEMLRVVDLNVRSTVWLVHRLLRPMLRQGTGRILFTGSIAGTMPGAYQAVYNASKSFVNSFALALREELKDSGVTVTCLMPGPTDTDFFERAGLLDTAIGQGPKESAEAVASAGYKAMMVGEADVVPGLKNKLATTMANVVPNETLAHRHADMAKPGSGSN